MSGAAAGAPAGAASAAAAGAAAPVAWGEAMRARWDHLLGDHPERGGIMDKMTRRLAASTADVYGGHYARFYRWCAAQPDQPSSLPASTGTVLRWLEADVTAGGKVRARSLQPYLSAINSVHADLEYDRPALGHAVAAYKSGLAHMQADGGREAERVYLPAEAVERALLWALTLPLGKATARQKEVFRAAVATCFTFTFFARGATGAGLLAKHVTRSVAGTTVQLEHEKGRGREARARAITLPTGAIPGLDALLAKWEAFRGAVDADASYYLLPGERSRAMPTTSVDEWLRRVLAHFELQPPAQQAWSGHSLRKGAASAASAIGVSLDRVCFIGGWKIKAATVHDYIDPTCPATAAGRRFFGWLLPAAAPS